MHFWLWLHIQADFCTEVAVSAQQHAISIRCSFFLLASFILNKL